jgi:hypothetical protein
MSAPIKSNTLTSLLAISIFVTGLPACGDDDSVDGAAGNGGSRSGSGGSGGAKTAGSGGAGGAKAGGSGGHRAGAGGTDAGVSPEEDVKSKAAGLRVKLNLLLSEHLTLAAKATGAALGGRMAEFTAYGDLLNTNGTDLGALVETAFGADAKNSFNTLWSAHNGYFVAYTTAVGNIKADTDVTANTTARDAAVSDLVTKYVPGLSELLAGPTGIPQADIEGLLMEHVLGTKAIVDNQADKNWPEAYASFRSAFGHMQMIGDALSTAIASKKPEAFPGDTKASSVDLRVALNAKLQEHLYLATFATSAALRADNDETTEALAALGDNGTEIGAVIGGLYDTASEDAFNTIWSAHNGYFVDYTTAVGKLAATPDDAPATTAKMTAVTQLTEEYVPMFAALLHTATDLPDSDLRSLTTEHVTTTAAVVDAQAAGAVENAAAKDRLAAQHMQKLGDPLAIAIVVKLAAKF